MQFKKRATGLFLLFIFAGIVFSKEIPQHPDLLKGTLGNGLTYYIYPNDYPKGEAVYRLFIKSGSIYETDEQKGLAHFLEHMAFNGTRTFPENELVKYLESKGAKFGRDLNAHTSYNETVYKLRLPSDRDGMVDTTITILADWLDGLLLEEDEIDSERGVIMSEWRSKLKPEAEVNDVLLEVLMNDSRYSERKVIGDTAVIQNFDYQTLRDYYESWYQPNLAAVAIVGDVDPHQVEKMIHEKFGGMKNRNDSEPTTYLIPDYREDKARVIRNGLLKKTELTMIQLIPKSEPVRKEDDYCPYLERVILNRLFRNRLNTLSFTDNPYTKGSVGISDFLNVKGIAMASVELMPNKIEEGAAAFISQLNQIFQHGFLPEEIDKVKRALLSSKERSAKSVQPVTSSRLMDEVYADFYKDYVVTTPQEEFRLTEKYMDRIDSTSISHALKKIVNGNHTHYIYSTFDESGLADSTRLLQFVDSVKQWTSEPYHLEIELVDQLLDEEPSPGSILSRKDIPEMEATELMLSNGVRVIYKGAVSSNNRITISAYKRGGVYALDSVDYMTGIFSPNVVSLSGAGDLSRDELSYFLAGNSASVRLLIENARAGMVGSSSLEDIETLFQLMYLKWTRPVADSLVFDLTKKRSIESYRNKNVTEQTLFYQDLNYLMRGKDYVSVEKTDSIIEACVEFDKIIPTFNRSFGNANGFTFVMLSDMELEELIPYINRYVGSLPSLESDREIPYLYSGGDIHTSSAALVREAGDSDNAVVSLIFQNTKLSERKDVYDLKSSMASSVLRMKLLSELREKMGMVYSVSVSSSSRIHPAPLARNMISFTTDPENWELLIEKIKEILKEMSDHPDSFEKELESVKLSLVNDMAANVQKDAFWSSYIRNSTFNEHEDWRYISTFSEIVNSVTHSDLSSFISNGFAIDNMIKAVLLPAKK